MWLCSQTVCFVPVLQPTWLVGEWGGVLGEGRGVVGDRRPMPLDMAVDADGRVFVRLDSQSWTILDKAKVDDPENGEGCWLRGTFQGDRKTVDTNRREYRMMLEVRQYEGSDGMLCGSCVALSTNADDHVKSGNALTDFVLLRKRS